MFTKSLILFFLCFSSCVFCLSAATPPDPFLFSKKLIETIKQNNRELYLRSFEITGNDIESILQHALANPYLSEREKERMQEETLNKEDIVAKIKVRMDRNFTLIEDWVQRDTINLAAVEFIDFYFELELKKNAPFYAIDNGDLFIKHGTKFYKLRIDEAAFINGQWKYGEIDGITEVDDKLNYIDDYYYESSAVDTAAVAVDSAVAVVDTFAVEPYYEEPYAYPELNEKQAEKAEKIQKKIDALYEKKEKLYNSLY